MAWSQQDQNPEMAPPASSYAMPSYAQTLNSYAYGTSGGGSMAPSSSAASRGERNYAQELSGNTAQKGRQGSTSRALQQSASPPPAQGAGGYVVQRGDNLTKIGQRFGMSPAEIARANNIRNPNRINAGQRLTIPGGGGGAGAAARPGTAPAGTAPAVDAGGYVVQRGDNLTRIAQQYGMTAQEIAQANGIRNPNRINPGQRLTIPGQPAEANVPSPRMRPSRPGTASVDPGRFDDAFQYAPAPERQAPFDAVTSPPVPAPAAQESVQWNIDGALDNMESEGLARGMTDRRRMMETEAPQPAYRAPPRETGVPNPRMRPQRPPEGERQMASVQARNNKIAEIGSNVPVDISSQELRGLDARLSEQNFNMRRPRPGNEFTQASVDASAQGRQRQIPQAQQEPPPASPEEARQRLGSLQSGLRDVQAQMQQNASLIEAARNDPTLAGRAAFAARENQALMQEQQRMTNAIGQIRSTGTVAWTGQGAPNPNAQEGDTGTYMTDTRPQQPPAPVASRPPQPRQPPAVITDGPPVFVSPSGARVWAVR